MCERPRKEESLSKHMIFVQHFTIPFPSLFRFSNAPPPPPGTRSRRKSNRTFIGVTVKSGVRATPSKVKYRVAGVTIFHAEFRSSRLPWSGVRPCVWVWVTEVRKWRGKSTGTGGKRDRIRAGETRQSNFCTTTFSRFRERNLRRDAGEFTCRFYTCARARAHAPDVL